jgi:hypothetical protein
MSKKGTKKATHHTLSLFLPLRTPDAPAALGAGGAPVPYCEMAVEVGVVEVLSVEPATFALEGSGVGREMGEAEPREAEELYENGGAVGNSVLEGVDSVLDGDDVDGRVEDETVTVERMVDAESVAEPDVESAADDDGTIESLVDVEVGNDADVDEDAVGAATKVVVVVVDALDSMSEEEGSGGVGGVTKTVVVVVVVMVAIGRGMVSVSSMDDRSPRSMVEPASSALPSAGKAGGRMLVITGATAEEL